MSKNPGKNSFGDILIFGVFPNSKNFGVQALTQGSIKALKKFFPEKTINIIDYDDQGKEYIVDTGAESLFVSFRNLKFSKKFFQKDNVGFLLFLSFVSRILPYPLKSQLLKSNPRLHEIWKSQLCLSIAGGDSFSDIYGFKRFLYVTFPQMVVLVLGKQLVQLPQTYGPFEKIISRVIASCILKRSRIIFSRDSESQRVAVKLTEKNKKITEIHLCSDVGFLVDVKIPAELPGVFSRGNCGKKTIGLNISGLLMMGGYTRDNAFGLRINYPEFIFRLIDHLIMIWGYKVLLIPHVMGRQEKSESDWVACSLVYDKKKEVYPEGVFFIEKEYGLNELKYLIGQTDFFIGSRMHACIGALSQCVPAVAISYSRKFAGVYEKLGLNDLVIDPKKWNDEEIIKRLDCHLENREETRKRLQSIIPGIEDEIFRKISVLKKFIT